MYDVWFSIKKNWTNLRKRELKIDFFFFLLFMPWEQSINHPQQSICLRCWNCQYYKLAEAKKQPLTTNSYRQITMCCNASHQLTIEKSKHYAFHITLPDQDINLKYSWTYTNTLLSSIQSDFMPLLPVFSPF